MESDWQLKCKNLNQRIGFMFKSGQWTDCTFLVGLKPDQEKIECHRNILASASPVFAAMFYGEMAERQSPILIPDIRPEAFRAMLKYIYTEQDFKISSIDVGCNLYYAADKYNLPFIKEICVNYINSYVDDNFNYIFQIYEFATLYEEKSLMNKCLQIMSTQTRRTVEDNSFIEAQVSTVVTIFSLERISCFENHLFTALVRYLKAQEVIMESMAKSHSTDCSKRRIENSAESEGPLKDVAAVNVESDEKSETQSHSQGGRPTAGAAAAGGRQVITPEMFSEAISEAINRATNHRNPSGTPMEQSTEESVEKSIARVLLEKIRFLTYTAKDFALGPAQSGLLTESEAYAILVNIVSEESPVPMPNGFSTSRMKRSTYRSGVVR